MLLQSGHKFRHGTELKYGLHRSDYLTITWTPLSYSYQIFYILFYCQSKHFFKKIRMVWGDFCFVNGNGLNWNVSIINPFVFRIILLFCYIIFVLVYRLLNYSFLLWSLTSSRLDHCLCYMFCTYTVIFYFKYSIIPLWCFCFVFFSLNLCCQKEVFCCVRNVRLRNSKLEPSCSFQYYLFLFPNSSNNSHVLF